ncbi:MAG: outer membrane protein [Candidatus Rokuibacteriota bacterium]
MKPAGAALLTLGCLLLLLPGLAAAEPYIAAYAGLAIMQDKDLKIAQDVAGVPGAELEGTLKGVEFDRSTVFGAKVGYFFNRRLFGGNLGFEYEVYHFRPDINGQTIDFSGTVGGVSFDGPSNLNKADISVIAGGLNFLYRIPLARSRRFPRGQVQPYVGVGGSVFLAEFETTSILDENEGVDDTDLRPGLQGLAGLKLFLSRNVALFLEYKYIHTATFEFKLQASGTFAGLPNATETTTLRGSLTGHHFNAGLALHF